MSALEIPSALHSAVKRVVAQRCHRSLALSNESIVSVCAFRAAAHANTQVALFFRNCCIARRADGQSAAGGNGVLGHQRSLRLSRPAVREAERRDGTGGHASDVAARGAACPMRADRGGARGRHRRLHWRHRRHREIDRFSHLHQRLAQNRKPLLSEPPAVLYVGGVAQESHRRARWPIDVHSVDGVAARPALFGAAARKRSVGAARACLCVLIARKRRYYLSNVNALLMFNKSLATLLNDVFTDVPFATKNGRGRRVRGSEVGVVSAHACSQATQIAGIQLAVGARTLHVDTLAKDRIHIQVYVSHTVHVLPTQTRSCGRVRLCAWRYASGP